MHIRVLGPIEVLSEDGDVRLGGPKQRATLALLAVRVGKTVSVDSLIEGLWGNEATPGARSTLQTHISNLRHELGDVIVSEGGGYRLELAAHQVDAVEFEEAVVSARRLLQSDPAEVSQRLRAALALWRGHAYMDVVGSARLELEAARLEELRLGAVQTRIEAELALGLHADLVPELEMLCSEFPLWEGFRAQHMLALYRSGRQAEALRAFRRTRTYLAEELGLEPSPELREIEHRVLTQDSSLDLEVEPQVQTLAFLLTDIEDSTVLWETRTEAMRTAVAQHDQIVRDAVQNVGGRVVKRVGDGIDTAYADVGAAVQAAEQIQRGLAARDWGETGTLLVRMAIDVGEVESRGGDYFGPVLNRAGRMCAAAHGGQVLLSADAQGELASTAAGWQARALGEYRLKGIGSPQNVFQLVLDGLPADFPPLRIDRLPAAVPPTAFGSTVRGYELREQVGSGGFGVVYRAYQPSVGREVAIKVIRAEFVNQASFVRGFEAEARLVAQLEHPHIVSLYDYWRDPEGAYLVMRWLRGGSLSKALERGPWNRESAARLLAQVGGALAYAHRQGVIHGDLRPANVLLDDEGYAYLSDFGIAARIADPSTTGQVVISSPAYVPPEALDGQPHTPRSDLYSLGLLTFELLAGQHPPVEGALPSLTEIRPEFPEALDRVIERATARDPRARYESVGAFLAAFVAASGTATPPEDVYTPSENPYKGLRAFAESDAEDYFGRDSLVAELVEAVREHRLVGVVGPSGIGKSSVVRAGLIPALRGAAPPESEGYVITDMFPGSYPYEELAAALLRVAVERPEQPVEELARDELGIARVAKRILPPGAELLLVIDQFEELFTLTADEQMRRAFLDGLTRLVADRRSNVRVIVTIRADFLDKPLRYPEFGELLRIGMVAVTAPSDDDLAAAIEGPAGRVGVRLEPGLVTRIVADVQGEPGALPLFQHALTELFANRTSDVLTLEGYHATGGVLGALGRRAEELYGRLDPQGQAASRQILLRLVRVDPHAQDSRRRVRLREFRRLELETGVLEEVIGRFGEHRLLTFDREPLTRSPTVEVAHDALLGQWGRARVWIDERREDLLLHRRLTEAIEEWEESGRRPDYLPRESRVAQFETWAGATDLSLTVPERDFLAEANAAAAAASRRRARRRRAILAGFASITAVALFAAAFALVLRDRAEEDARLSRARQLAATAQANLDVDPELSILLGIEAIEATRQQDGSVLRQAEQVVHDAISSSRVLLSVPGVGLDVDFAPDGSRFAASDIDDKTATVRDAETGDPLLMLRGHSGAIRSVEYSRDGRLIATAGDDGQAIVWDARTGEGVTTIRSDVGKVLSARFNADGDRLVTLGEDSASVWDVENGRRLGSVAPVLPAPLIGETTGRHGVAFLPGDRLVVANGALVTDEVAFRVFDASSSKESLVVESDGCLIYDVEMSPDGGLAAVADGCGLLYLWRLPNGNRFDKVLSGHVVTDIAFSADGKHLATAGIDGSIKLWDVSATGVLESFVLHGHQGRASHIAFSRNGKRLVSAGLDGYARVWDVSLLGRGEALTLAGPQRPEGVGGVAYATADRIVTVSALGTVRISDAKTRELVAEYPGVACPSGLVDFDVSPDGSRLASGCFRGSYIFDLETGKELAILSAGGWTLGVAFSPDGTMIATTGSDGNVRIFDAQSGEELKSLSSRAASYNRTEGPRLHAIEWSPDGSRLLAMGIRVTSVWEIHSGRLLHELPAGAGRAGSRAAWSPDGAYLFLGGSTGVGIWNAESGAKVGEVPSGEARAIALSPDGTQLAIAASDGTARIWNWRTSEELLVLRHKIEAYWAHRFAFSPDGGLLAVQRGSGQVHVFALHVERLLDVARGRVTRGLTDSECEQYLQRACSSAAS